MKLQEVTIERHPVGSPPPVGGNWHRIRETIYFRIGVTEQEIREDVKNYAWVSEIKEIGGKNHKLIEPKEILYRTYGDRQLRRVI